MPYLRMNLVYSKQLLSGIPSKGVIVPGLAHHAEALHRSQFVAGEHGGEANHRSTNLADNQWSCEQVAQSPVCTARIHSTATATDGPDSRLAGRA